MYNIQKEFDKIWSKAREANKAAGMERFRKIEEAKGSKFKVFGIDNNFERVKSLKKGFYSLNILIDTKNFKFSFS